MSLFEVACGPLAAQERISILQHVECDGIMMKSLDLYYKLKATNAEWD